ncbi:hypothetical protein ACOMHN_058958 [Nucella lapillus]
MLTQTAQLGAITLQEWLLKNNNNNNSSSNRLVNLEQDSRFSYQFPSTTLIKVPVTPNKASLPTRQFVPAQAFGGNFRGQQQQQQQQQTFPGVHPPHQPQSPPFLPPSPTPGQAKQDAAAAAAAGSVNRPQTFAGGSFRGTGSSFLPSSRRAPFGAQCFRRQDLAASYKLSDSDSGYPE